MKTLSIMMLLAMGALVSQTQAGLRHGCPHCGCSNIKKVCRLVPETRKVTTFCYGCKCEDFCVPGPSPCCGKRCVPNDCSCTGSHVEHIYGKPCCGKARTRKVLVKVPVTKEVQGWTCTVERICCGCGCAQLDAKATTEARAQEIMPASGTQEFMLDPNSSFEEGGEVIPAAIQAAPAQQVAATEEPAVEEVAEEGAPKSLLERLLGK